MAEAEPDGAESPVDFDPLFDKASAASSPGVAAGLTGSLPSRSQPDLPAFGEASLPLLSDDVLLSSSIDGQVLLWDRRTDGRGAIRRLPVPEGTPPWSMQVRCLSRLTGVLFTQQHRQAGRGMDSVSTSVAETPLSTSTTFVPARCQSFVSHLLAVPSRLYKLCPAIAISPSRATIRYGCTI